MCSFKDSLAFFPHYWNIPRTPTTVQGKTKKTNTELDFARSQNRSNVSQKPNADGHSLMTEVFIV